MIFTHYLKRIYRDKLTTIMLILFPIAISAVMTIASNANVGENFIHIVDGYNIFATNNFFFQVIFFQFFGAQLLTDYLYLDFRSDMRWRLKSTPKSLNSYIMGAIVASFFVNMLNSAIILGVGYFVFDAHVGNLLITAGTLALLAIFLTFVGILLFMLVPKKSTTTAIIMAFAFAQFIIVQFTGVFNNIDISQLGAWSFIPIGTGVAAISYLTPVIWVEEAMTNAESMRMALTHMGILAGYAAVAGIAALIIGRKRPI